jgi:hypothetical protein
MLGLIPDLWGYIAAGAVTIAVYFGAVLRGRELERKDREIEKLNRNIATQKEIDDAFREVDGLSDDDIARLLSERSEREP